MVVGVVTLRRVNFLSALVSIGCLAMAGLGRQTGLFDLHYAANPHPKTSPPGLRAGRTAGVDRIRQSLQRLEMERRREKKGVDPAWLFLGCSKLCPFGRFTDRKGRAGDRF